MKKIYKNVIFLVLVLLTSNRTIGQSLEKPWILYPNSVDFNVSPPVVSLLPGADPNYNGSYIDANGVFSETGQLQFYLVDKNLYDGNGIEFGELATYGGCGYEIAEANIVPVPGYSNRYYIIYSRSCGFIATNVLYATVNCATGGCTILNNGNLLINNINGELVGLATSRLFQNNTRRLYLSAGHYIKRFEISSQGISFVETIYEEINSMFKFDTYQLELSGDNTKLAWGSRSDGSKLNIIDLDQYGSYSNYYTILISDGIFNPDDNAYISGVEFSKNSEKVYVSISDITTSGSYLGGLFYYDFTLGMVDEIVYDNFKQSHLQQDHLGYIYAVNNNGTAIGQIDPNDNSFNPSYLIVDVFSYGSQIWAYYYSLPDLTDSHVLSASPSSWPESCASMSDGKATATAHGGVPPYTYLWDDPAAQTTPTAINLSPGIYTCIVTDALNATASTVVEVITNYNLFSHHGDWNVYGQEGITGFAAIDGDIHIHNGGTFEVDGNLEFNANKGIIIYAGGTLKLKNNATLSGLTECFNNYWNGIVIHENADLIVDNSCTISKGNVVLEAGKELTLTQKTVYLEDNSIIIKHGIVQPGTPGGKLVLDGSTFTSVTNKTWQGIEVWGDNTESQYTDQYGDIKQGYLVLKNEAIIENAIAAVELWEPGDFTTTGGIVQASNTTFSNNTKSIHALNYTNTHPVTGKEMNNLSYFKNCTFEITSAYIPSQTFYKHVDLARVKGFNFEGCTFSVVDVPGVSIWNGGIASYSAGFSLAPVCTTNTIPCNAYRYCTFDGFNTAVYAGNPHGLTHTFWVDEAEFSNNIYGIRVELVNNYSVLFSNFQVGHNAADEEECEGQSMLASGYGISSSNCTGFAIEENDFTKMEGAPRGTYTGILVSECPSTHDIIYKNEFTGLSYGNYAYGINRSVPGDDQTGVEYRCNLNANNSVDFVVTGNIPSEAKIRTYQGLSYIASGNTFSSTATWHYRNEGEENINYYFWDGDSYQIPDMELVYSINDLYFDDIEADENTCPSHYGGGNGGTGGRILLTEGEKLEREQAYLQNLSDYQNVKALYDYLKDGGNTEALQTEIETSWPTDMWELRAELLGKSPHLSKEVLMIAADKTDVLPESVLFEILSANPDELKEADLIKHLEDKEQPLPQYMIDILQQLSFGVTYKTILKRQMADYHAGKTQAALDMIRSILSDTITDIQQYRNWLDNLGSIEADKQIIASYLSEGNYSYVQSLLNLLPALYELEGKALSDFNDYKLLLQMQMNWEQQGRNIFELDSAEVAVLADYAENSTGEAKYMARGILTYAYGYHYCDCLANSDSTFMKSSKAFPYESFDIMFGSEVTVNPNPAGDWTTFNYQLPDHSSKGIIEISNVSGVVIERFTLTGRVGQKVWDTRKIESGVYLYTLKVNGISKSGKIVIH